MSESTITHSANGVTCTIEMTADEYLVSTEPLLRIMVEGKDFDTINELAVALGEKIKEVIG